MSHLVKRLSLLIFAALAATGAVVASAPAGEVLAGPIAAEIVRVVDGDTIIVRARIWLGQRVETKLRLAGVDAPEIRGRCASEKTLAAAARDFVAQRLGTGPVTLHDIRYGKFAGRVVARIETPQGDLGQALLGAGLARAYAGGRRRAWCG